LHRKLREGIDKLSVIGKPLCMLEAVVVLFIKAFWSMNDVWGVNTACEELNGDANLRRDFVG